MLVDSVVKACFLPYRWSSIYFVIVSVKRNKQRARESKKRDRGKDRDRDNDRVRKIERQK